MYLFLCFREKKQASAFFLTLYNQESPLNSVPKTKSVFAPHLKLSINKLILKCQDQNGLHREFASNYQLTRVASCYGYCYGDFLVATIIKEVYLQLVQWVYLEVPHDLECPFYPMDQITVQPIVVIIFYLKRPMGLIFIGKEITRNQQNFSSFMNHIIDSLRDTEMLSQDGFPSKLILV